MGLLVRPAESGDAQLIADLTRAAWGGKVALSSSGHRETALRVLQDLRDGGGFVLLLDEVPAGSVRWMPLDAEPTIWEILRMGVLPEHRGSNLSQHLLEAVIHQALESDVSELRLAVRTDQPQLLDFYTALGFEPAAELEYSHANPLEPAPHVMRRLLRR
jgi:ribosomal protein S18 acetylase RimI-like enzyme